ncbi:hypothetical protein ABMA27_010674 [Loxostege sticticalis]|uniref:Major facilitator superfamily (MFS) profile domain-containing protein n=1 Tax=Loxostege sticticalis TaxID=481309 RepID=A0ABR3H3Y5_LOXSC
MICLHIFFIHNKLSIIVLKVVLAALSCWLFSLGAGCTLGFTAVLLPQIKEDPNFPYNDSYNDSWVASSACLAMAFGCIITGVLSDRYGRRITQLAVAPLYVVGWIAMAFATNITLLILGRVVTGMCYGAFRSIGAVYLGEIANPTNRPLFNFSLTMSVTTGTFFIHILGGYLNWRLACFIVCVPVVLGTGLQALVKESPLWLIYKGKIAKGTEAFTWFRGNDECSQNELEEVLLKQKNRPPELTFKEGLNAAFSKSFMKPLATAIVLFKTVQCNGVNTVSFYAQDLLKTTFSGEQDPFMLMLVTDVIRVFGVALLFCFSKYLPRRKSYLIACGNQVILLIVLIAYIAFKPSGCIWFAIIFFMSYITLGCILIGLCYSFMGEIFPSQLRGLGSGISASSSFLLLFLVVNLTPKIIMNYGIIVLYSINAVITLFGLGLLYILLPVTDGKTLQEIENNYTKN